MPDMEIGVAIIMAITFPAFIAFEIWYFRYRKKNTVGKR